jgi:hypothetical protein
LQEQQISHERELADLVVYEDRKRAELQLSLEQELADAAEARDRKLEDLLSGLDKETQAMLEAEMAKTDAARLGAAERIQIALDEAAAILEAQANINASRRNQLPTREVPPSVTGPRGGQHTTGADFEYAQVPLMAGGGSSNMPFIAGDAGAELIIPSGTTRVIPNHQMGNYLSSAAMSQITNNNNLGFSLNNPATLTPEQQMITRQIAENTAINIISKLTRTRSKN